MRETRREEGFADLAAFRFEHTNDRVVDAVDLQPLPDGDDPLDAYGETRDRFCGPAATTLDPKRKRTFAFAG